MRFFVVVLGFCCFVQVFVLFGFLFCLFWFCVLVLVCVLGLFGLVLI